MVSPCDRSWELDAAREGKLSPSDVESFARHRRVCQACTARAADVERLRRAGQSLFAAPPADDVSVRRLRARILREAAFAGGAAPAARGRVLALAAALVIVGCAGGLAAWSRARTPRMASVGPALEPTSATVLAGPATTWSRRKDGATERVRLVDGSLALEVRHQEPGERFVVELPDGEIEVRGTRFEVQVGGGQTLGVRVLEGRVALRRGDAPEVLLGAGDSWSPPLVAVATSAASPAPALSSSKPPPSSASSRAAGTAPRESAAPLAYDRAMALYRAGKFDDAAHAFRSFGAASPQAPEAEDAAFLEAASLSRAGRADAAALVAERFLERYPGSLHARDAAILVARAARARGDCEAARRVLAPWAATPSPAIAAALGRCAS